MMLKGFRIAEMAERVVSHDDSEELDRVKEQLRYWTREGLLVPITPKHSGRGRWRRYNTDQVYIAALLAEFARTGWAVGGMKFLVGWLMQKDFGIQAPQSLEPLTSGDEDANEVWDGAAKGKLGFLIVPFDFDESPSSPILTANADVIHNYALSSYSSIHVFNLARIFEKLDL